MQEGRGKEKGVGERGREIGRGGKVGFHRIGVSVRRGQGGSEGNLGKGFVAGGGYGYGCPTSWGAVRMREGCRHTDRFGGYTGEGGGVVAMFSADPAPPDSIDADPPPTPHIFFYLICFIPSRFSFCSCFIVGSDGYTERSSERDGLAGP